MAPRSVRAKEHLKSLFGFDAYRGEQGAVIDAVLSEQDTLLLMPTGMGKSLCYQLPARVFAEEGAGLTLVISPLIALMKDQVDAALKKGMKAAFINSSLTSDERKARYRKLAKGEYEILYVTPERFRIPEFLEAIAKNEIALLAVDEAHCISAWGHDFRPDYSRLGDLRSMLGNPTTLALTATATPTVQSDILAQLSMPDALVFNQGVKRPNLAVEVLDLHGMDQKVQAFMAFRYRTPGPTIVYFSLVSTLSGFSRELGRLGIEHLAYHGQLQDRDRRRAQEAFLASDNAVMLATPAFGLGVDKPNVRMVMHAEMPGSIESYYQEIGRAGRDGKEAECVLLFDDDDVSIQTDFMEWANPDPGFIRAVYNLIERNLVRARQEGFEYLRGQMNFHNRRDYRVETAVNQLERWGAVEGRQPKDWNPVQAPPEEYLEPKLFELRMKSARRKLYEMVEFANLDEGCRMTTLQAYFGFPDEPVCGKCDLCQLERALAGAR